MRKHIDEFEAVEVESIFLDWKRSKEAQADCVDSLMDMFGCDADRAVDMLNAYGSSKTMIDAESIEIHNSNACQKPWGMDGQAGIVILLAVGGYIAVLCMSGV